MSASVGGPIKRDRMWFFGNYRDFGAHQAILGMFGNKNTGNPTKLELRAGRDIPARSADARTITALRLTTQVGSGTRSASSSTTSSRATDRP